MRIVHIHQTFYPFMGGIERVVNRLAIELAKLGHEVHVVTSHIGGLPVYERLYGIIHVHRVRALQTPYPDLIMPLGGLPRDIRGADIVHIHSQNSVFNIRMGLAAKRQGLKVAVHFMAVDALRTHPNIAKKLVGSALQGALTWLAVRLADIPLAKSVRDRIILNNNYNLKSLYVPDGIDDYYFKLPPMPQRFLDMFGIDSELVYIYIGRLHPAKGPQILLKAAKILARRLQDFTVAFIGPGNFEWLRVRAEKYGIADKVVFTGPVSESIKISAIDASTAVIIPSLYDYVEVYSLVASEAFARGKPVVASSVGELRFRIRNKVNGILVPPANPRVLARAMMLARQLTFKGPTGVLVWSQVAKMLERAYNEILKKSPDVR